MSVDSFAGVAPPAGLYEFKRQITDGIDGVVEVHDDDIMRFHELGFLLIRKAISQSAIVAARAGLRDVILRRDTDNIMIESAAAEGFHELGDEERLNSVRKLMPIVRYDRRLRAIAEDAGLLSVLKRVIGETPVLTQDMAMIKPPRIGREKPWHQDLAYFDFPKDTTIVGAWIALDEAVPENGCMMIIPGSHREGPVVHWTRRDWQICDGDVQVDRCAAVPMQRGDCLLFHCLLHHGTPPSRSDKTRWAVQFHYAPKSVAPYADSENRLRTFGADGKDVTC
ncbi:MAG: phytanoyl-CoA dioxygenase family protein [Chloroflexi bacterium]|nr:phytanoyl-CoA dioxygenase family protein [Chloroflexota bacterium]